MQFPLSQRRHTNIAVVRYTKNGVKLEIACYKNKVISYRSGLETRLDEVLQVDRVFSNVGRGHVASEKDIQTVFGEGFTEQEAIKFMLEHGELQVAQQERTAEVDEIFKDIAVIISQKCVHKKTHRPFPSQVIEQALRSMGAAVKLDQPVKKQALGLIHQLIDSDIIPITRADMKLRCMTIGADAADRVVMWCEAHGGSVLERQDADGNTGHYSLLLTLQPNLFRELDQLVKLDLPPGSTLQMVEAVVMEIGEGDISNIAAACTNHGSSDTQPLTGSEQGMGCTRTSVVGTCSLDTPNGTPSSSKCKGRSKVSNRNSVPATSSRGGDSASEDIQQSTRGPKAKTKKANPKGRRRGDDSSSDNDSVLVDKRRSLAGADNDLTAQLKHLGIGIGKDDDASDDHRHDGRGGGRGCKNKRKNKRKDAAPVVEEHQSTKGEAADSDAELDGNRKQRKKGGGPSTAPSGLHDCDEDSFDYGEEDD